MESREVGLKAATGPKLLPTIVKHRIAFSLACAYEILVLGLAFALGFLFGHSPIAGIRFTWWDVGLSLVATLPPLGLFIWTINSAHKLMEAHRRIVDSVVKPIFEKWSTFQLGVISVLAGVCEEAFFRGVLQGSLSGYLGEYWALVTASLAFGVAHFLTWTYALLATLIGAYLGALYLLTGNLLVPISIHALYDFIALLWLLPKWPIPSKEDSKGSSY